MLNNKNFTLIIIGVMIAFSACNNKAPKQLIILHTNDSHSQVEATKDGFAVINDGLHPGDKVISEGGYYLK